MKASFKKDFAYAMTPLKILSWPVGTWPLQVYNIFSNLRTTFTILFMLLMMAIVQTELYLDSSDAGKNLDAMVITICGILGVSKVICFRIWPAGLIANFTSAVKDYKELDDDVKRSILRHHAYMTRMVCACVIFFAYFAATLFSVVPMIVEEEEEVVNATEVDVPEYPIPSEYTLAIINMPHGLIFLIFIVELLMLFTTDTANLGSDLMFIGIIFHLCGQVEVLKLDFSRLIGKDERVAQRFKGLVKRHIYLLQLANMLNETISSILIVQLFSSCVLICISGFQCILALSVGNMVLVVKAFMVVGALLAQLLVYSYVGDYLNRRMESIGTTLYSCNWYDLPRAVAKDIVYVIMRAQDPVQLSAGNFFIVNLETYMSILKTSISYLSVLRVMISTSLIELVEHLTRMKASFKKDFAYAMTPLKILSWPVGTWPLQVYNVFSNLRTIFTILILLLMMAIVQTELYLDSSDAGKNLDAMLLIICGTLAVSKVMCFRIWPAGLIANFTSAVKDYKVLDDNVKRAILRRHAYMARMACGCAIFFAYVAAAFFSILPVVVEKEAEVVNVTGADIPEYPIPSEYTLAIINVSDNLFILISITEFMMLLITGTGNLGSDSLFVGIVFHLCGQVEILKLEFSKLSKRNERVTEHFKGLVKRHIHLLKLAKMLNETVSSILVVQIFSSCVLICTGGFQCILAMGVGNTVLVIKTFMVMGTLLVQLLVYSYVGDYLKRRMESVGNTLYSCNWYKLPRGVTKDIVYVIMRAHDPVQLTAGQFFVVNMQTYMSILKTSISYLSVLRVMVNV
ncbi:uncharacterized protein LOC143428243 [Xylocopa sonorina]|uniref:uncharacterized protein LOC143428243 n=1 Tax=Xylocopa sonorina TaxID=1818115 RepID=UPI00403B385B